MNVLIESAIELDSATRSEIEATLSAKLGAPTTFSYSVNSGLLGGLRVRMGGKRVDASLLGKLEQVAHAL